MPAHQDHLVILGASLLKGTLLRRWATVINRTEVGRRTVVGKIMSALASSGVFLLFLNIVVVVFSVVGMQFFGGHFHWPDGTSSRVNFDNFYQVLVSPTAWQHTVAMFDCVWVMPKVLAVKLIPKAHYAANRIVCAHVLESLR